MSVGIPFFPMDQTRILQPLPEGFPVRECVQLKLVDKRIRDYLESEESLVLSDTTFQQLLEKLGITLDSYLLPIRSSLAKDKVSLKRRVKDIYVNNFSDKILRLHRANMDIQCTLDAYACCTYIVDYVNKVDRGMSETSNRVSYNLSGRFFHRRPPLDDCADKSVARY